MAQSLNDGNSVFERDMSANEDFDMKIESTINNLELLLEDKCDGKDIKLKMLFDKLKKIEENYINKKLINIDTKKNPG